MKKLFFNIHISVEALSQNAIMHSGKFVYSKKRKRKVRINDKYYGYKKRVKKAIVDELKEQGVMSPVERPNEKVNMSITRLMGHKQRAFDYGNFVGGCKPIPDVLQELMWIHDDSPKWVDINYVQKKANTNGFLQKGMIISVSRQIFTEEMLDILEGKSKEELIAMLIEKENCSHFPNPKITIEYDGKSPTLCMGNLVVVVDGKKWIFPKDCLLSGGKVFFDDNHDPVIEDGDWVVDEWPENFPGFQKELVTIEINKVIPLGCCGGCV